jgi:hypothetical protein
MTLDFAEILPNLVGLLVVAVAAMGALALPWSDSEVLASRDAWFEVASWLFGRSPRFATVSSDELLPAPLPRPSRARAPIRHVASRRATAGASRR